MTDIIDTAATTSGGSAPAPALSALRLPELQAMAATLGVKGTSKMRKGDLLAAISGAGQPAAQRAERTGAPEPAADRAPAPERTRETAPEPARTADAEAAPQRAQRPARAARNGETAGRSGEHDAAGDGHAEPAGER
ncbi:Rho termination factor N-terminal domain-containing protein, partial [Cellulomonas citrea]|uniref:Rho termination factor N-terminal domain-containing protein n=1 Tax=Cellulomonas citrea TaxID=1909423 RepID=UPI001F3791D8